MGDIVKFRVVDVEDTIRIFREAGCKVVESMDGTHIVKMSASIKKKLVQRRHHEWLYKLTVGDQHFLQIDSLAHPDPIRIYYWKINLQTSDTTLS